MVVGVVRLEVKKKSKVKQGGAPALHWFLCTQFRLCGTGLPISKGTTLEAVVLCSLKLRQTVAVSTWAPVLWPSRVISSVKSAGPRTTYVEGIPPAS